MKRKLIFLLAVMLIFFSSCTGKGYKTMESAVENAGLKDVNILHIEEINADKALVFYESSDGSKFGCGLVNKSWTGWNYINGEMVTKPQSEVDRGLIWASYDFRQPMSRTLSVMHGIITNPKIKRVELKTSDNKAVKANLITAGDGTVIWYTTGNKLGKPSEIKGVAANSQLLYYYPHKTK